MSPSAWLRADQFVNVEYLGTDEVVHDVDQLPMFDIADISLAVTNATPKVRRAATAPIGGNAAEGVAQQLPLKTQLGR